MAVTLKGQSAIYEGTSADMKPSDAAKNAIFQELDTGIDYYYDGTDWNEIPSSGGGGGGTGTDNYNELNNKPSINGTTLSGNKSLDNLDIQKKLTFDSAPTEDSENPVESGGVYSALAGKQDTISDLPTIRSGAAAGATAVQPADVIAALATKQDVLTTEQLAAVNSGITAEDVEQITTNKNNILSLDTEIDSVTNLGAKNLLDFGKWASNVPVYNGTKSYSNGVMTVTATGSGCATYHNQYFPEALKIPVKKGEKYTITWDTTATTNIGFFQLCPNGNAISGTDVNIADKQTEYTVASGVTYLTYRVGVWASGNSINISKLMLRPATISDSTYQPYAMSNAELTAAIQALQAQLANQ